MSGTPMTGREFEPIPQLDLKAQFAAIRAEIGAAIEEVLASQQFILGPQGAALEQEVARICGTPFGIGVASGTDALVLSLRVCGVGPGDEVIAPAFTFIATTSAVTALGAHPVFADIEAATYNLDRGQLEARISAKTKAIIVVHLYGLPTEMDAILEIARRRNIRVIEDSAQAIGASYKGRPAGSMGDLGCISFYPTKNLGAYGDAGMIVTRSEELAARLRILRHHGQTGKYVSTEQGWNSRLDEIQAAVLRVKLRHLAEWQLARQRHAEAYTRLLGAIPGVVTPSVPAGLAHVYHQYTIRVPRRDHVQKFLAARQIGSTVYYPVPLHLQPVYASLGYQRGDFPVAERAADEVLSLPMYPDLRPDQIERVAKALAEAVER
ncbi:MAG TPA: DegT/DnrJ/EryC1/StrS family aminotransferase [Candidatus Acidoferrales bacterium]|nr:DegT/DnrJ/EryC1/StrS family aminotransferase [Candidatus Acidoferrales bacterium]